MSSQVFLAVLVAFNFLLILLFFHPPLAASSKKSFRNNGGFSYDMSARNGPLYWSELNMEGNECGGTRNSPIDISLTEQCNLVGGYSFQVRRTKCYYTKSLILYFSALVTEKAKEPFFLTSYISAGPFAGRILYHRGFRSNDNSIWSKISVSKALLG